MPTQTQMGKAFEYAVLRTIYEKFSENQPVSIVDNSSLAVAKDFYGKIDRNTKDRMNTAAGAAIRHIVRLEPQLEYPEANTPLLLSLQEDAAGQRGDVRDVLTVRQQNNWQIGVSCKHNHEAVKHSRLSKHIDFGAEWLGFPCSASYFEEVTPLFHLLEDARQSQIKWADFPNKVTGIYMPVLNAFMDELQRLTDKHNETPKALVQYLLGRNDFYKVISNDSRRITTIQAFNFEGTLNQSAGINKSRTKVPKAPFPSKIFDISYKENSMNTIIVTCDHGWSISMRIHSASTIVEPSLKFDVKLDGIPQELYKADEPWDV